MEKYKQDLKNLLIEIQKDKSKNLLKETINYKSQISLIDLAEEILLEYDNGYYERQKEKEYEILRGLKLGRSGKGAWKKKQYEHIGDYEERVQKADYKLGALLSYIKKEVEEAWKDLSNVEAIKNMDDESKKEIVKTMVNKMENISKEMLRVLSVYPFEWEFDTDNINIGLSKMTF
jgi:F0F1-type ATP synthase delta subunit